MPKWYESPRWSGELTDCALPMMFDQYSSCGYDCLYCFSFFQRARNEGRNAYLKGDYRPVNVEAVKRIFTDPDSSRFGPYVKRRFPLQWGGLSDPFCPHERERGVGLELLRFFRELRYPVSFSTKGEWFTKDDRYREVFAGADHFHVKVSIITLEREKATAIERACPSPGHRLRNIERLRDLRIGGVTLRLRPFILGVSDQTCEELIGEAAKRGADSVSTEFLCMEHSSRLAPKWTAISRYCGFDLETFYRSQSRYTGYYRLNRNVKRPYIDRLQEACAAHGLRFYVSDSHFKERSAGGCCCGIPDSWEHSTCQWADGLLRARTEGTITFSEVYRGCDWFSRPFNQAGINDRCSPEKQAATRNMTVLDWLRFHWNNVNSGKSPYKYFGGVLRPDGRDENGDVIYRYVGDSADLHSEPRPGEDGNYTACAAGC